MKQGRWSVTLPNGATITRNDEESALNIAAQYDGEDPVYHPFDHEKLDGDSDEPNDAGEPQARQETKAQREKREKAEREAAENNPPT